MTKRFAPLLMAVLAAAALMAAASQVALRSTTDLAPVPSGSSAADRAHRFWALYGHAGNERTAGRLDSAARLYRQALDLRPDHEDSLYYLASCLREQGEYLEAVRLYQALIAQHPEGSSRGYMQLASIRASLDPGAPGDLADAQRLYERALAIDPDSGALLGLAEIAVLQQRPARAERLLASVETDNPISVAAPYLRGYLAFEAGHADDAWKYFATAVARFELKKGPVKWTEEGDLKASPELRWHALARQSVFGSSWLRLRVYLAPPGPTVGDMRREYERLHQQVMSRWR